MRFLILDSYYHEPISIAYRECSGLEHRSYAHQLEAIEKVGFGRSEFLLRALRSSGHDAEQVIVNAECLQRQWAIEHGVPLGDIGLARVLGQLRNLGARLRAGRGFRGITQDWQRRVVSAQVQAFRPDVLVNCDLLQFPPAFLREIKAHSSLLVGECAYPLPPGVDLSPYDLILSSGAAFVDCFRKRGARVELWRHAFEPSVVTRLSNPTAREGVVFIGSLTAAHTGRIQFLESLARRVPILCYGSGAETLAQSSPLQAAVRPALWGYAMYERLRQAQIAINFHIDIARDCANNLRLYETTGVGTLLITDWKADLRELFEPGRELLTYRTADECADLILSYLRTPREREAIAAAGQRRTLSVHTYTHRAAELIDIVERFRQGS